MVGNNFADFSKYQTTKWHWLHWIITASGNIWMLWFTVDCIEDLPTATSALSISIANMLTVLKAAVFLSKKKSFVMQIEQLQKLNDKCNELFLF